MTAPVGFFSNLEIVRALEEYEIPGWEEKGARHIFTTIRAERLTPDSSATVLLIGEKYEKFYILYSEDFIDTLATAMLGIEHFFPCKVLRWVRPKKTIRLLDLQIAEYYMQQSEKKMPNGHLG